MTEQSTVRERVVVAASAMLAQHGLNATSIRETIKRAEAPLGSTYHHFPGGKHQLVVEAVELAGAQVSRDLERQLQAGALAGIQGFLRLWRDILLDSDFRVGCPVMAVAVEEPVDEIAQRELDAAAGIYRRWEARLQVALVEHGHTAQAATGLATLLVAAVQGVIPLCRAQRSIDPFDRVAERLVALV
ncbi:MULTISPECIES: TetR/AcrR family transcriptional regulator [unclassified Pseudomonas]|jgi:AcrR family transcriptional regulator|uniref:TetR/AcrR family transcriptional regulator n=1 Tax=unclassified Pseudomonas TaxID=196821 RepID=UPI00131C53E5|nr:MULTISPECIES: TetR/AcrR family transcriptional regulator [unclassified Pseudomonas]